MIGSKMTSDEEFATAVFNVAHRSGFDITGTKTPVPRGFWIKVVDELGVPRTLKGRLGPPVMLVRSGTDTEINLLNS